MENDISAGNKPEKYRFYLISTRNKSVEIQCKGVKADSNPGTLERTTLELNRRVDRSVSSAHSSIMCGSVWPAIWTKNVRFSCQQLCYPANHGGNNALFDTGTMFDMAQHEIQPNERCVGYTGVTSRKHSDQWISFSAWAVLFSICTEWMALQVLQNFGQCSSASERDRFEAGE